MIEGAAACKKPQSGGRTSVELYFLESFTFRLLTTEAVVVLAPEEEKEK